MTEMKIKKWFIEKQKMTAQRYDIYFTFTRRTDDVTNQPVVEDDCYFLEIEEILAESEKAIRVKISSGDVVGSFKGWTTWIPKSVIEF